MKKTLITLGVSAALFAACSRKEETTSTVPVQNPFNNSGALYADGRDAGFVDRIVQETPEYIAWRKAKIQADRKLIEETEAMEKAETIRQNKAAKNTSNSTASNKSEETTNSTEAQPVKKRKGWSNAAKGTVIGAGSGAVVGVVVSKNKGKGALVGGVIGAGLGYIIGNEKDKKAKRKNQ